MTILVLCTKSYRQAIAPLHGNHGTQLDELLVPHLELFAGVRQPASPSWRNPEREGRHADRRAEGLFTLVCRKGWNLDISVPL